jgi:hypothetical protein
MTRTYVSRRRLSARAVVLTLAAALLLAGAPTSVAAEQPPPPRGLSVAAYRVPSGNIQAHGALTRASERVTVRLERRVGDGTWQERGRRRVAVDRESLTFGARFAPGQRGQLCRLVASAKVTVRTGEGNVEKTIRAQSHRRFRCDGSDLQRRP